LVVAGEGALGIDAHRARLDQLLCQRPGFGRPREEQPAIEALPRRNRRQHLFGLAVAQHGERGKRGVRIEGWPAAGFWTETARFIERLLVVARAAVVARRTSAIRGLILAIEARPAGASLRPRPTRLVRALGAIAVLVGGPPMGVARPFFGIGGCRCRIAGGGAGRRGRARTAIGLAAALRAGVVTMLGPAAAGKPDFVELRFLGRGVGGHSP